MENCPVCDSSEFHYVGVEESIPYYFCQDCQEVVTGEFDSSLAEDNDSFSSTIFNDGSGDF